MEMSGENWGVALEEFAKVTGEDKPTLIHYFWMLREALVTGYWQDRYVLKLEELGLVQQQTREINFGNSQHFDTRFLHSEVGKRFLLHLRFDKNFSAYEEYIFE